MDLLDTAVARDLLLRIETRVLLQVRVLMAFVQIWMTALPKSVDFATTFDLDRLVSLLLSLVYLSELTAHIESQPAFHVRNLKSLMQRRKTVA